MGLDQAFGLSFRHHVIAGYQFIMRYYSPGDCIYIFGFSRGAYTARFLAEMLQKTGLLSRGKLKYSRLSDGGRCWKSGMEIAVELATSITDTRLTQETMKWSHLLGRHSQTGKLLAA